MREIKFRAWFTLKNKMVLPENLQLSYDSEDKFDFAYDKSTEDLKGNVEGTLNFELMQYTGLKDKNGKEIYEGDILKVEGSKRRYVVQWNEEELAFTVDYRYANDYPAEWILSEFRVVLKTFEVIGNIYENPELLNIK